MKPTLPRAVRELASELTRLPGIGPKTAQRLALYLLRQPHTSIGRLADTIKNLHANVRLCQRCFNLAEQNICAICGDPTRAQNLLCVVEDALDVEAIERSGSYDGLYHVLGGLLSPLKGIGPEQLTFNQLTRRLDQDPIEELIIALDPIMEGEATARQIINNLPRKITITRLARGLPTGGDIEFADAVTLSAAISGRKAI